MPTELDLQLHAVFDRLTQPGAQLALGGVERFGRTLPTLAAAPPALPQYFAHFCAQHGDAEFLIDGDIRLSFAQTYAAARAVAGGLVAGHGLQRGDRVGIAARNSANWIIAYMGVLMAGGVATLLNGWWQGEEMLDGVRLVECRYLLADAQRAKRLEGMDHGAQVILFAHDCPPLEGLSGLLAKGGGADTPLPDIGPDDLATILFTSGSTGQSKGAYSDHRGVVQGTMNYVAQTLALLTLLTERGEPPVNPPATLPNVPLFHVTAEVPVLLQSFAIGRKLVLMPKWDAGEAMRLIAQERCTYFVGVPLMSFEIATHPDRHLYDLSSCITFAAGGAPRPLEHVTRIKDAMPHAFPILGYGLTETNAVGCGNFNENYMAKPNSTGPASRPLVELAMLDDDGRGLPQGAVGEVAIRSVANFIGYWNNDAATRAAITDDGWFRTGDLGYLDEDGYLFIVDRKKDIIIRGGENISCIEVESAIYAHPDVGEASVFGLADERFGEVPGAVFLPEEGRDLDADALLAFLQQHLAPFKLPARIWKVADPLPRLGTEKVDKVTLRKQYGAIWAAEAGKPQGG